MIRIAHVINNLQTGGAETTLLRLMEHIDRSRFEPFVLAMIGEGTIGPRIREMDIPVVALGAARRRLSVRTFLEIRRHLKEFQPDVIQSWMYHSNLAAYLSRGAVPNRPALAWNIRHSLHDLSHEPWMTRQVIKAGAKRSAKVEAIIANSAVSMRQHEAIGYRSSRNEVIPNGFDLESLKPFPNASTKLREEIDIGDSGFIIGCAARFHPMKDQQMLVRATAELVEKGRDIHCVLIGRGCESGGEAESLRPLLGERLHLLGERRPLAETVSGLDCLAVASAWGEGFPNVLAEAMACEVPCVTTDVGDAAAIVADPERVISPRDQKAMVEVVDRMLQLEKQQRQKIGQEERARILENYPIAKIVKQYEDLWVDLASSRNTVP
ncbi:MAG: glycosyl transferase family 1 [Phycisphaerae bacterium]|nr:glycosyl transferase family 1 [Phycisphaerae bacterium]|tara:strand:- start:3536 stop:4678 length:1143 start_codon:yes stop_codon:yes gene_type:complete